MVGQRHYPEKNPNLYTFLTSFLNICPVWIQRPDPWLLCRLSYVYILYSFAPLIGNYQCRSSLIISLSAHITVKCWILVYFQLQCLPSKHWYCPNARLLLGHRRRRCTSIHMMLGESIVFPGQGLRLVCKRFDISYILYFNLHYFCRQCQNWRVFYSLNISRYPKCSKMLFYRKTWHLQLAILEELSVV